MSKTFFTITLAAGALALVAVALLVYNDHTAGCDDGHVLHQETGKCFYLTADQCPEGMLPALYDNQAACVYDQQTKLNSAYIKVTLGVLALAWLIIVAVILTRKASRGSAPLKKDLDFNEARDAVCLWWCREFNIPMIGDQYPRWAFEFTEKSEPGIKGGGSFHRFQMHVLDGNNQGVFTITVPLHKGVNHILGGNFHREPCAYDNYRVSYDWPMHTTENPVERQIEMLRDSHPELAAKYHQQMVEQALMSQPPPEEMDEMEGDQSPAQFAPQPQSRRRARRPQPQQWRQQWRRPVPT